LAFNPIKAVIFDFGETLVTFGKIDTLAYFKLGAKKTFDFLMSLDQPAGKFKIYRLNSITSLMMRLFVSRITKKDFDSLDVLKKAGQKRLFDLNEQQWQQLVWLWYEPLKQVAKTEPDLAQTMQNLKQQGLKLAIVSNTFVNGYCLDEHLKELGIFNMFDSKLYSYQFTFRKPDQRIFIAAADSIAVHLPNILYVGDRIDKDIKPTLKLDMHAALKTAYTNKGHNPPAQAWKIDLLSQLPDLIEKYNSQPPARQ
jgi:HAD superfamily hydrolase (TIGR01549 family)